MNRKMGASPPVLQGSSRVLTYQENSGTSHKHPWLFTQSACHNLVEGLNYNTLNLNALNIMVSTRPGKKIQCFGFNQQVRKRLPDLHPPPD
jgi:hypothetical protein